MLPERLGQHRALDMFSASSHAAVRNICWPARAIAADRHLLGTRCSIERWNFKVAQISALPRSVRLVDRPQVNALSDTALCNGARICDSWGLVQTGARLLSAVVAASGCGALSTYQDEKRKERQMIFSSFLFPTQCELLERLDFLGQGCFGAVWKVKRQVPSCWLIQSFALQDTSSM